MKTVILVNVGTPESSDPQAVGRYLREFLMDENIIPLRRPWRDLLVKALIVPRRKFQSSEKYQKIWTQQGSPLMVESFRLQAKLQSVLGPGWSVVLGMQVGQPALRKVLQKAFEDSAEIYFCPLYPQFATATTGGALKAFGETRKERLDPAAGPSTGISSEILAPFYQSPWFIKSVSQRIAAVIKPGDHLLLSYHGLPVSQLQKHRSECYQTSTCCQQTEACAMNCYKAQCLKTSELIQTSLNWTNVSTSFQSRLGRARWIEPSTEDTVEALLRKGIRDLKVACPSFVVDCLETLEEIGMELRHRFLSGGGKSFELIPCVNDDDAFVRGLAEDILRLQHQKMDPGLQIN